MKSTIKTIAFTCSLLLASCDEVSSTKATEQDPAPLANPCLMPAVGFLMIEFGTGGGFSGGGTGEFLRLTSDGLLMRVAAKPLQTDSGPQWSGKYDTTRKWISAEDLLHVDSVLHSRAVLSPELPDSAFEHCRFGHDGFYWKATARFSEDSVSQWIDNPLVMCRDDDGSSVPPPVHEGSTELFKLENRLLRTYFQIDPVEN